MKVFAVMMLMHFELFVQVCLSYVLGHPIQVDIGKGVQFM